MSYRCHDRTYLVAKAHAPSHAPQSGETATRTGTNPAICQSISQRDHTQAGRGKHNRDKLDFRSRSRWRSSGTGHSTLKCPRLRTHSLAS